MLRRARLGGCRAASVLVALAACVFMASAAQPLAGGPHFQLAGAGTLGDPWRVELVGLAPAQLAGLERGVQAGAPWNRFVAVHLGADDPAAIWGKYSVEGETIIFRPRFPLRQGQTYAPTFDPAGVEGLERVHPFKTALPIPAAGATPATRALAVYPTATELPENLLKFYVEFSAPMSVGESGRRLRIVDESGDEVPDAFLELQEELWDPAGKRLTILFDPGRLKRGVKPNEEVGAPLAAGKSYRLVVDAAWRDAAGQPLASGFEKRFRVTAADARQPRIEAWMLTPPKASSSAPLAVTFDEPLDRAMLEHAIRIIDSHAAVVEGSVTIEAGETRWLFTPRMPWSAGDYQLLASPALEDAAGNSLGRAFEERIRGAAPVAAAKGAYVRSFNVLGRARNANQR